MKIPGLLFLATSHNVSKAYLSAMHDLGMQPERTLYIEFKPEPDNNPVTKVISFGNKAIQFARGGFHHSVIPKSDIVDRKSDEMEIFQRVISAAFQRGLPVEDYFTSTREILKKYNIPYESIQVPSLNDERFIEFVSKSPQTVALYVDGGILRRPILSTHIKFIHVHPGHVPDVRGTSCLLWGALVHNRIGASCFFMNDGIDKGDVLMTKEYEIPVISIPHRYMSDAYAETRYIALQDYLDPCYRADVIRTLLKKEPDPAKWCAQPQDLSAGRTYYHPHKILRDKMANRFFKGEQ